MSDHGVTTTEQVAWGRDAQILRQAAQVIERRAPNPRSVAARAVILTLRRLAARLELGPGYSKAQQARKGKR